MGVGAAELGAAVHPERVVPDDPTPTGEAEFAGREHLEFGRVLVADRQPERAVRAEHPLHAPDPPAGPREVVVGRAAVVVGVVVVADVERRVREREVDARVGQAREHLEAVTLMDGVERKRHG